MKALAAFLAPSENGRTDTIDTLKPAVQAKLGDVFRDLVDVDERGVATRRRVLLNPVKASTEAETLVSALTEARLLVTDDREGHEPLLEVAHEALFRSWPRLKQWNEATPRSKLRGIWPQCTQQAAGNETRCDSIAKAIVSTKKTLSHYNCELNRYPSFKPKDSLVAEKSLCSELTYQATIN